MRSMAFGNRMNKRINDEEAPAPDYDYLPEPVVAQVLLSAFRLGGGGGRWCKLDPKLESAPAFNP